VSLPETIPVRYTEEEAEYLSFRRIVRQTFRLQELLDMVLGVTGKDLGRVRQILRSGTVVYHSYRYWWPGFDADAEELARALAGFPDADPDRGFRAEECTAVLFESVDQPRRSPLELGRAGSSWRRLFRSRSFWDCLLALPGAQPPSYQGYSYARRADLYQLALTSEQVAALGRDAARLAHRELRHLLGRLAETTHLVFVCPREKKSSR
jgi:hypothetical protein